MMKLLAFLTLFLTSGTDPVVGFDKKYDEERGSSAQEICNFNVGIRNSNNVKFAKTYHLYSRPSPTLQAQAFCEENDVHLDDVKALVDVSVELFQQHFSVIELYDNAFIDQYCPSEYVKSSSILTFLQCSTPLDNLYIMHNEARKKDAQGQLISFCRAPYLLGEESECPAVSESMIPYFLGRIFMVKNVCLTSHGHIFTDALKTVPVNVNRFMTGKMYDNSESMQSFKIQQSSAGGGVVPSIDLDLPGKRALLLVHAFANNFGHEFIDLYPQLFMFRHILEQDHQIPVIVRAPLSAIKMFPLLHAMGIHPERLNYHVWKDEHLQTLYCLEEVVTTTSSYASHVSPEYIVAFREALLRYMTGAGIPDNLDHVDGILFSDRRDMPGQRNVLEGELIQRALLERYGGGQQHPVRLFFGNESLDETIQLFRCTKIFISVHGAQMSNMLFLPPGAVLIEIQPYEFRDVDVFLNLAPALGVIPFRYTSMSGGQWTSTSVNVDHFLGQVTTFIDSVL